MSKDKTREQRIETLTKQMATSKEAIEVFSKQYNQSKEDLKEIDEAGQKQISEILARLPEGATPKGVLDDILKVATPKRTQVLNNISKLAASIRIEQDNYNKLHAEKSSIENEIIEEGRNEAVKQLCQMFTDFQNKYLETETHFLSMKSLAMSMAIEDPGFSSRVSNKYPEYYAQVLSALFKDSTLPELSIFPLVQNIANYPDSLLNKPDRVSIRKAESKHISDNFRLDPFKRVSSEIEQEEIDIY